MSNSLLGTIMINTDTHVRTDSVYEVRFTCQDSPYPFIKASEEDNCRIELAEMFPRPNGEYAEFFSVTGADPARVAAQAADYPSVDVTLLSECSNGGFIEFRVSEGCPAFRLTEFGALPRKVCGDSGRGHIIAEVPSQNSASEIVDGFLAEYPDFELLSKQKKDSLAPRFNQSTFQGVVYDHLTDRQREVVQTAFEEGYYNWPRECTGEDVAEKLGIASPTFAEHIKAAERKLLAVLFDDSVAVQHDSRG